MDGLTQSFDEKIQPKVDTSTVDGKYNQSGFIWKELSCGFHCPPYPLNSKLGYSGWAVFYFLGPSVPTLNSGGRGEIPTRKAAELPRGSES